MNNFQVLAQEGTQVNVELLDHACKTLFTSQSEQVRLNIDSILTQFSKRGDIPIFIEQILSSNCGVQAKFISLSAFDKYVNSSWSLVPDEKRHELRQFMLNLAFQQQNTEYMQNAINSVIVSISKYEYPNMWPSFVQDLLSLANNSPLACCSVLNCFSMFSSEINEFAENSLTSARAGEMVNYFEKELDKVIELIQNSLSLAQSEENFKIISASLDCLRSLVKWINPQFFFQTDLLSQLCSRFISVLHFSPYVINILAEIVSMNYIPEEYYPNLIPIFLTIIQALNPFVTDPDFDLVNHPFSNLLACTLTSFLSQYSEVVEVPECSEALLKLHQWLVNLTGIIDDNFESLIDYWHELTQRVYSEVRMPGSTIVPFYTPLFPSLRRVLMRRIPAPFEFQNIEEEDGFKARRIVLKTNFGDLFTYAKDALVYLTHMDPRDTVASCEELRNELQQNFTADSISKTCWSFGAVVGALSEQNDRVFVAQFITFFIQLFQQQQDENVKTCIASATCFMCWQANKFLARDDQLLRNIVDWMFSLLQFNDNDVKSVSIECLKCLCQTNRDQMIAKQAVNGQASGMSVLEQILSNYEKISSSLSESSLFSCFELTGMLIKAVPSDEMKKQMFTITMHFLDNPLKGLLPIQSPDPNIFHSLTLLMQCNTTIAIALGDLYVNYFLSNVDTFMQAFLTIVNFIVQACSQPQVNQSLVSTMRIASDSIVNLFDRTLSYCFQYDVVSAKLFPLCMSVLESFANTPPIAKSPKVLSLFGTLSGRCKQAFIENYQVIFSNLFIPVFEMIKPDFVVYEAIRLDFFNFLLSFVRSCTDLIVSFQQEQMQIFLKAIKFGMKHPQHDVSEKGHAIMIELIENVKQKVQPDALGGFVQLYALKLTRFAFKILSDTTHKFSFSQQAILIKTLLSLPQMLENAGSIMQMLTELFPEQSPEILQNFLQALFMALGESGLKVNEILKDFLVSVRHLLPHDPDLMAAQKKEAIEKMQNMFKDVAGLSLTANYSMPDAL
ncbi:hypothetical protein TRFO_08472 [Tritrichomonas foetus]|uniref:Importin N-terminal domain-containing protein n=1 Tax=Tritrichomonas foetus TaxID=1144522 RepID=A0A1J4JNY0_9EUKA|nr:hypothetical protein TRFO_08472 [Tritrichomonas foetus]|eukprot:OHS99227.1 hypothetical protein TRFO_08472 [Tritrichomonas foetus]